MRCSLIFFAVLRCSGSPHVPLFKSNNFSAQSRSDQNVTHFDKLSNDDKVTVESILHLKDKFGVVEEFVHELSVSVPEFPIKSYHIKKRGAQLNEQVKITIQHLN